MPQYFRPDGSYDRKVIDDKARGHWRDAVEQGAVGETATLVYWQRYCWRVARGKRQMAAFRLLERAARQVIG